MIKRFVFTDKSVLALEKYNQYTLDVNIKLTKLQIRLIIEKSFFVRVLRVNTFRKRPVHRRSIGCKETLKRAIVTLAKGERLEGYLCLNLYLFY
jgi:ribosomal protein L23